MKIQIAQTSLTFTDKEKEAIGVIAEMAADVYRDHRLCETIDCAECPFGVFCRLSATSKKVDDIIEDIESYFLEIEEG